MMDFSVASALYLPSLLTRTGGRYLHRVLAARATGTSNSFDWLPRAALAEDVHLYSVFIAVRRRYDREPDPSRFADNGKVVKVP